MARPEGFEPPAPRFVVWCSIQLSYGRAGTGDIGARAGARNPRLPHRRGALREQAMRALALLLLLAGCVSQGPFPSLAPREGEQLAIEEPEREAPTVADEPALRARIAALRDQAREGMRTFDGAFEGAERSAARAGAEGSDSWVEAQLALSRLEAARGRTADAAAELDRLDLERADQATSAADQALLEEAIAEAARLTANQQDRIERIRR
jgi:hypothetical protein